MTRHEKINYLEFPAKDIKTAKSFFSSVFNWEFIDYGPDYTAFGDQGIDGGFFTSNKTVNSEHGSVLVVFYSERLENTQQKIEHAGGTIIRPVYSFPGGRRFHFTDPNGNEYGVWSDKYIP
jgi:hypothetical protein